MKCYLPRNYWSEQKKMSIVEFIFKCHAINVHKFNCFTDSDNLKFYECSSRMLSNYHIIKCVWVYSAMKAKSFSKGKVVVKFIMCGNLTALNTFSYIYIYTRNETVDSEVL